MIKWEYLRISAESTYGTTVHNLVVVRPRGKIELQWLAQQYPKAKRIARLDNGEGFEIKDNDDLGRAFHALIDHVGADGWEPFSADGMDLHFKRQV